MKFSYQQIKYIIKIFIFILKLGNFKTFRQPSLKWVLFVGPYCQLAVVNKPFFQTTNASFYPSPTQLTIPHWAPFPQTPTNTSPLAYKLYFRRIPTYAQRKRTKDADAKERARVQRSHWQTSRAFAIIKAKRRRSTLTHSQPATPLFLSALRKNVPSMWGIMTWIETKMSVLYINASINKNIVD